MVGEPGRCRRRAIANGDTREALDEAGSPSGPSSSSTASAIDPRIAAARPNRLLDLTEPPTAIFSVNNITVVGVAEAARERGLEIPRDVSLVCFDDIETPRASSRS